jgi:hypothetical protein
MPRVASTLATFGRNVRGWTGPRYRPEKHYMRGPGPACAARAR